MIVVLAGAAERRIDESNDGIASLFKSSFINAWHALSIFELINIDIYVRDLLMNSKDWWQKQRIKLGLRKVELAKKAGLSVRTIMRLESGDASITPETKSKVRNVLMQSK